MARKIASIHETTKAFTPEVVAANTGTTSGTWAAGNDSRITGAQAASALAADVATLDANAASTFRAQQDARHLAAFAPGASVKAWGAACDGRLVTDAQVTAGAATVTSTQAAWTAADVGKVVVTVTDYNDGTARFLSTPISASATVTSLVVTASVTLAAGARVQVTAYENLYEATVAAPGVTAGTTIPIESLTVDASGVPAGASVFAPDDTTVVGTIASVNGNVATLTGADATAISSGTSLRAYIGTDDYQALQDCADDLATGRASGGQITLPRGITMTTQAVVLRPAHNGDEYGGGGMWLAGTSVYGSKLVLAARSGSAVAIGDAAYATDPNTTHAQTVVKMGLRDLTLQGPGPLHTGTRGLDKRITGTARYDNLYVHGFGVGLALHDSYESVLTNVMVRKCDIGRAFGFAADGHAIIGGGTSYCRIGDYWGWIDPIRGGTAGANLWHANTIISNQSNDNWLTIFIQGVSAGQITYQSLYTEFWSWRAVQIGDKASAHGVPGRLKFDNCRFSASKPFTDKWAATGRVAHAIEVNLGYDVTIDGLNAELTSDAPLLINNTSATVEVKAGSISYNPGDSVQGEVKLPDASYVRLNIAGSNATRKHMTYGRRGGVISYVASLPTATADWLGARLRVYSTGVESICEYIGGSYVWSPIPRAASIATAVSSSSAGLLAALTKPSGVIRQTHPRTDGSTSAAMTLTSGLLTFVAIALEAGDVVTTIGFRTGSTALSGGSHQWFGLWNSSRQKLGVTADDTSTAWGATSAKELSLTTPYTVTTTGIYYLSACVVASTMPNLAGKSIAAAISALTPVICGTADSGLTTPATAPSTAAGLSGVGAQPYAYIK